MVSGAVLTEEYEYNKRWYGTLENSTNKEQTRLFAYLASNESHFPSGEVTTWDWKRGDNNPLISKPSSKANTAIVRRPGTNQIRLISGRVASVGGVPDRG